MQFIFRSTKKLMLLIILLNLMLLREFDGENDGIVGRLSSVGGLDINNNNLPLWMKANPPQRHWTNEVHSTNFIGHAYYKARGNGQKSQAYECIKFEMSSVGELPQFCRQPNFTQRSTANIESSIDLLGNLHGAIGQSSNIIRQMQIDQVGKMVFYLSWLSGNLEWTLTQPDGIVITPNSLSVVYEKNVESGEFFLQSTYTLENTMPGLWTINISANEVPGNITAYSVLTIADSSRTLTAHQSSDKYRVGETAQITVSLQGDFSGIAGATVTAAIDRPDGVVDMLNFSDLGNGTYKSSYLIPNAGGMVMMSVKASGIENGIIFNRLAKQIWSIIPNNAKFVAGMTHQEVDVNFDGRTDQVVLTVPINVTKASTYTVVAHLSSASQLLATSAQTQQLAIGKHSIHLDFNDGISDLAKDTELIVSDGFLIDIEASGVAIDELQEKYRFAIKAAESQHRIWLPITRR